MSNSELKRLTIQVTAQQKEMLSRQSKQQHIPISVIIRQLLRDHLPNQDLD